MELLVNQKQEKTPCFPNYTNKYILFNEVPVEFIGKYETNTKYRITYENDESYFLGIKPVSKKDNYYEIGEIKKPRDIKR